MKRYDLVPKLIEARDLISDPDRWAQGWFAYDAQNQPVNYDHELACKWCALGAINKVADIDTAPSWELESAMSEHCDKPNIPESIRHSVVGSVPLSPVVATNDFLGHEGVIKMFNDTIEALSEKGR